MEKMIRFEDLLPIQFLKSEDSEKKGYAGGCKVVDLSRERDIDPEFHALLFEVFARG